MLNLRKLEERIVLAGAEIDQSDAPEDIQEQEAQEVEKHLRALEVHNQANWDYDLDLEEPLYLDLDTPEIGGDAGVHVLMISSDIADAKDLEAAAKDDVLVIPYDASETTIDGLAGLIEDTLAKQGVGRADTIAFASHNGDDAQLALSRSDIITSDSLENDPDHQAFWQQVGNLLNEGGRIDLLACSVTDTEAGGKLVSQIEDLSGADVAASDDPTGSDAGSDWILETGKKEIDLRETYFDSEKLSRFDGTLQNAPPVVNNPIEASEVDPATEGEPWEFTVPLDTFIDPEGDEIAYWSLDYQHPEWITMDGSVLNGEMTSMTLTGTPPLDADTPTGGSSYETYVTIMGTDPEVFGAAVTFTVTVNEVDEAPLVSSQIGTLEVAQGTDFSFTIPENAFEDPEGGPLTYTIGEDEDENLIIPDWLSFDGTTFTGTPSDQADVGTWDVKVVAEDETRLNTPQTFQIRVTDTNDAPITVGTINPIEINEGEPFSFEVPTDIFFDPDGDTLSYWSLDYQMPGWLLDGTGEIMDADSAVLTGTPGSYDVGTTFVTVMATDPDIYGTAVTFQIIVNDVNTPPELLGTIENTTISQQDAGSTGVSFTIPEGVFEDPDVDTADPPDVMYYHAELLTDDPDNPIVLSDGDHPWIDFDKTTGEFIFTPVEEDAVTDYGDGDSRNQADYEINVWAYDSHGDNSDPTIFSVTVENVNSAPVVNPEYDFTTVIIPATQEEELSYNLLDDFPEAILDPDGDELKYWALDFQLPTWLTPIEDADTPTLTGTPGSGDVGTTYVTVMGTDPDILGTAVTFRIQVTDVPTDAPVIENVDGDSMVYTEADGPVVINADASVTDPDFVNFPDFEGGTLTVSISGGLDNTEDLLRIAHEGDAAGQIGVYDDPDLGPMITYEGGHLGNLVINDASGTLTVDLTAGATEESVSALLQHITYENTDESDPTDDDRTVTFSMTDGDGGSSDPVSMTISIEKVNSPPVIENIELDENDFLEGGGPIPIDVGDVVSVTDPDSPDFDGGYLEVRIVSGYRVGDVLTTGTIESTDGILRVDFDDTTSASDVQGMLAALTFENTNDNPQEGTRNIRITLSDGDGGNDGGVVTVDPVIVNVAGENDPPVISGINDDTVLYVEGDGPVEIDAGTAPALVEDADSLNFDGGTVTVEIVSGFVPGEDLLRIRHEGVYGGEIGVDGNNITYTGDAIGTFETDDEAGTLTILFDDDDANADALSKVLQQITYENASEDNPTEGDRVIQFSMTDGDGGATGELGEHQATVTVQSVNDPPTVSNVDGADITYTEGEGQTLLDPEMDALAEDPDTDDFNGGFLTVQIVDGGMFAEDRLSIAEGNGIDAEPAGGITFNGTPFGNAVVEEPTGTLTVNFSANATPEAVSALIGNITYENIETNNPTEGTRTVAYTLSDGGSENSLSNVSNVLVTVEKLNNAPVIQDLAGDVLTYTENDFAEGMPLDVDPAASVSDVDGEKYSALTVQITGGFVPDEDALTVQNEPGFGPDRISFDGDQVFYSFKQIGTFTYEEDYGLLSIDLIEDAADDTSVSKLIQNITYSNSNSFDPVEADRTVSFVLWDAEGGSSAATEMTVQMDAENDAPVIVNVQDDVLDYEEGDGQVAIDQSPAAIIRDVDSDNLAEGRLLVSFDTASYQEGEDALTILNVGQDAGQIGFDTTDGVVSYGELMIGLAEFNAAEGELDILLTDDADFTSVSALIQHIAYENLNSENVTDGERTVSFQLWEDYTPETGGVSSGIVDATVVVGEVNDPPEIHALHGDTLFYHETDGALILDQATVAWVEDVDTTNFDGAMLTVAILGGDPDEDVLSVSAGANIDFFDNQHVMYQGSQIGQASFDADTGLLEIELTEHADTVSISELVQSITFENTDSYDPTEGTRTVRFVLTDGEDLSAEYDVSVTVDSPNNDPIIENIDAGDSQIYMEDDGPALLDIDPLGIVLDYDSEDFAGGVFTVEIEGADTAEDVLSIEETTDIQFESGRNVYYQGDQIGTNISEDPWRLEISLDGDANSDALTALIQTITYENINSGDPTEGNRTVRFILTDGDGGSTPSVDANTVTVTVQGVNDAPILSEIDGDMVTFVEDQDTMGVLLDEDVNAFVTDIDNVPYTSGSLQVQIMDGGATEEDTLFLGISSGGLVSWSGTDGADVNYDGVKIGTAEFVESSGMLEVSFTDADESEVSALLQNIVYYNVDSDDPFVGERTVRFTLNDGVEDSEDAFVTLTVEPANDDPVLTGFDESILYYEDQGQVFLDTDSNAAVTDVDSPDFDGGSIRVEIMDGEDPGAFLDQDVLSLSEAGNITLDGDNVLYLNTPIGTFDFNSDTGVLEVAFDSEIADTAVVSEVLQAITYENIDTERPDEALRTLRISVSDGDGGVTVAQQITLQVVGVNDAPVIEDVEGDVVTFVENDGTTEGATLLDLNANGLVSDVDSDDFSGGKLEVTVVNGESDDRISIRNEGVGIPGQGLIGFDGTEIWYDADPIGEFAFDEATSKATITFTSDEADAEAVSSLIQNITFYSANSEDPLEGDRSVRFQLWDHDPADGGLSSEISEVIVTVEGANDGPIIHDLGLDDSQVYTEGAGQVAIDIDVAATVTDIDSSDFDTGELTVQIVGGYVEGEDVLSVLHEGSGADEIGVYGEVITYEGDQIAGGHFDPATGTMTLTLYDQANETSVAELIQSITYENTNTLNPTSGERTIRFALLDGDLEQSPDYHATIIVSSVNDAPVLANIDGDVVNYTEPYVATDGTVMGNTVVLLDQSAPALATDNDSEDFDGGKLWVEITDGFDTADDKLGIRDEGDNLGQIGYSPGVVSYEGEKIGDVTFMSVPGESTGRLEVTFNENADTESVTALLHNITYENRDADDPSEDPRTIAFTLWDGDGDSSNTEVMTLNVNAVNESPVITALDGGVVEFSEGNYGNTDVFITDGVMLDAGSDAVVTDVDTTDFGGGRLEVRFDTDVFYNEGEDRLFISEYTVAGDYSVTAVAGGGQVAVDGTDIGAWAWDEASGVMSVDFAGTVTPEHVSALIQHIGYTNDLASGMMHEGERTVQFTLYDGDYEEAPDMGTSETYEVTVNVTAENDPPVISGLHDESILFTEDSGPVALSFGMNVGVTDVDSPDFNGGELTFQILTDADTPSLSYQATEDRLVINDQGETGINYDGYNIYNGTDIIGTTNGFNVASGILDITLTEEADATDVQALIENIQFNNINSGNPVEGLRSIRFSLSDGDGGIAPSEGQTEPSYMMSVFVTGTNDQPVIQNIASDAVTFQEDGTAAGDHFDGIVLLDQYQNAVVVDFDGMIESGGILTIDVDDNHTGEDWLGISTNATISYSALDTTGYRAGDDYTGAISYGTLGTIADVEWTTSDSKLTIEFTASSVDPEVVQDIIRQVGYSNTNFENPEPGPRAVSFQLNDGSGSTSTNGLATSEIVTMSVTVVGVNDNPTIENFDTGPYTLSDHPDLGDSATYIESDGTYAATLQSGALIDDVDILWAPYSDFDGGLLTVDVTASGAVLDEDLLTITAGNGITVTGNVVYYNTEQLGVFGFNDGTLEVHITSDDPLVSNTDGVSALLGQVAYVNTDSDDPQSGVREISFAFEDGDGGANDGAVAYYGTNESQVAATMTLFVQPVNDAPVIENLESDVAYFNEGSISNVADASGGTTVLDADSNAVVTDVDSGDNFGGGRMSVQFVGTAETDFYTEEDVLSIRDIDGPADGLEVDYVTGTVDYEGDEIATYVTDTLGNLTFDFGSAADAESVSALLQNITYFNSNTLNPTTGARSVRFTFWDGDGTEFGGLDSAGPLDTKVIVGADNDAPRILDLDGDGVAFIEDRSGTEVGALPVFLDQSTNAYVQDSDSSDFDGGRLEVWFTSDTYVEGEDRLVAYPGTEGAAAAGTGIDAISWDEENGRLTITFDENSNTTTVSDLIQHIAYNNLDSEDASDHDRVIQFRLWDMDPSEDGAASGNVAEVTMSMATVNDAPELFGIGPVSDKYEEGSDPVALAPGGSAGDVDSEQFSKLEVFVSNAATGDTLSIIHEGMGAGQVGVNGVYVSYGGKVIGELDSATPDDDILLTFDEDADAEAVSAVIQNVAYSNSNTEDLTDGERKIKFQLWDDGDDDASFDDGGGNASESLMASTAVTVEGINDAPVLINLGNDAGDVAEYDEHTGDAETVKESMEVLDQLAPAGIEDSDTTDFGGGSLVVQITDGADNAEDVLSFETAAGEITISEITQAGTEDVSGTIAWDGSNIGSYSWNQDTGRMEIDFASSGVSENNVEMLLRHVGYYNLDHLTPSTDDRLVTFQLWDGDPADGGQSSEIHNVTLTVTPSNDGPEIENMDGDTVLFVEDEGPILIDQEGTIGSNQYLAALVTDPDSEDFDGGSLTVTLGGDGEEGDVLSIRDQGGLEGQIGFDGYNIFYEGDRIGKAIYDETYTLNVTLDETAADSESVAALIRNITFENTNTANPVEGDRTIRMVVDDGDGAESPAVIVTVTVTGVNDAPVIQNLGGDEVTFSEADSPTDAAALLDEDGDIVVTDPDDPADFSSGILTVQIVAGADTAEDVLGVFDTGDVEFDLYGSVLAAGEDYTAVFTYDGFEMGDVSWDAETSRLEIDFASNADAPNEEAMEALLRTIGYANMDSNDPTEGDRIVRFQLNDGDGTAFRGGEPCSAFYDMTVHVVAVNDAPILENLDGDNMRYEENDSAGFVLLDDYVHGAELARLTDVDSDDFEGGLLEVKILDDGLESGEDKLWIANYGESELFYGYTAEGDIEFIDGSNVLYDGNVQIGENVSYDPDTGTLSIYLTELATADNVSELIQNITYINTNSDDPVEGDRNIEFKLYDGDGGVTDVSTVTVTVDAVNDAPEIFNLDGDIMVYTEGAGEALLDVGSAAWARDVDHANYDGAFLTVTIENWDWEDPDVLGIRAVGDMWDEINVDGSDVKYGGTIIGSWYESGGSLTVVLDDDADDEAVSALIQNITFENTMDDLSDSDREVVFRLRDPGGAFSSVAMTVDVETVNDAPKIEDFGDDSVLYTEGDDSVILDEDMKVWVEDDDSTDFAGGHLSVQITNPISGEDELLIQDEAGSNFFVDTDAGMISFMGSLIGTDFTYDAVTATLDVALTEHATADNVDEIIEHLAYQNLNTADPVEGDRYVSVTLSDGDGATSEAVFATVYVSGVNDAPVIQNIEFEDSVLFTEGDDPVVLDLGGDGLAVDVDDTSFFGATLDVYIEHRGVTEEDVLSIQTAGDVELLDNGAVYFDGQQIGNAESHIDGSGYPALSVTFNSHNATPEAVSAVLQNVTYENTDTVDPTEGERHVWFDLIDAHGAWSNTAMVHIEVEGVNSPPEIFELDGEALDYVEGDGAVRLDQTDDWGEWNEAYVVDLDNDDMEGGHLYVDIVGGYEDTEDRLSVTNYTDPVTGNAITFSGTFGDVVEYNTFEIGKAFWIEAEGRLDIEFTNTGADTDAVSTLIQAITYENSNTDNLIEGERTIRFQLWDGGDGPDIHYGASSNSAYVTVDVEGINDPPVIHNINVDDDTVLYVEGDAPVQLDVGSDGYVSDIDSSDFGGGRLEVQILAGDGDDGYDPTGEREDELGIRSVGNAPGQIAVDGANVLYGGEDIGTWSFNAANGTLGVALFDTADSMAVSELIQNITYENIGGSTPTEAWRTIRFTVWDGDENGKSETDPPTEMRLYVEEGNSAPVIEKLAGDTLTYEEGDEPMIIDQGFLSGDAEVTDDDSSDFAGGRLTVQIVDGFSSDTTEDVLGINDQGDGLRQINVSGSIVKYGPSDTIGSYAYDPDSQTLEVDLGPDANEESVAALIQNITYENTNSNDPLGGDRVVRFTLYDGDEDGGTSDGYDVTINVVPVNDAPVIQNVHGDTVAFVETDGEPADAVKLDAGSVASHMAVAFDVDTTNFDGATLTVQVLDNDPDADVLSVFDEGPGARSLDFEDSVGAVRYGDVQINDTFEFDASSGMLEITLNENASSEAVSALIQNITYNNVDSDDPVGGDHTVRFVLWDADGASSEAADVNVIVQPTNDAPYIHDLGGDTVLYAEGGDPVALDVDANAVVEDVDSTAFDGGQIWVDILNYDENSGDLLDLRQGEHVTYAGDIDAAAIILYDGTYIGGVSWDADNGRLEMKLNETPDEAMLSELIQNVTFENAEDTLEDGLRTIRFTINDGDESETFLPAALWADETISDEYLVTVVVQGGNDAPVIENLAGDSVTYTKNDTLMILDDDSDALVTDTDSEDFDGGRLTVQITSGLAVNDRVDISTDPDAISVAGGRVFHDSVEIGTYTHEDDDARLVVAFNGNAHTEAVSELVQAIAFENTDTMNPIRGERTVQFMLYDGDGDGGTSAAFDVTVDVAENRAPEIADAVPDWPVSEGMLNRFSIASYFEDPDNDDLTFTASWVNEAGEVVGDGSLPDWLAFNTDTGQFMATPTQADVGTDIRIQLVADDSIAESEATTFSITVTSDVNHKPYFVRLDADGEVLTDTEGEPIIDPSVAFTISEHETVTGDPLVDVDGKPVKILALDDDPGDGETLTYRITGGNPDVGVGNFYINPDTGEISLVATGESTEDDTDDDINFETGPKAFTLEVEAEDSAGEKATGTVTIFIQDQNDEPEPQTIEEQRVFIDDVWIYNLDTPDEGLNQIVPFIDPDSDHLTYRAVMTDGGGDVFATTGWLNFSSSTNQFFGFADSDLVDLGDTFSIDLIADDGINGEVINTFTIRIITASADDSLRDAVRHLDDAEGVEEYFLPEAGEDVEIQEVVMYADAEDQPAPVAEEAADADLMDALALLDGMFDDDAQDLSSEDQPRAERHQDMA